MENSILSFREQSEKTGGPIIIDLFFGAACHYSDLTLYVFNGKLIKVFCFVK